MFTFLFLSIALFLLLLLLWCVLLKPRRNQPGWEKFSCMRFAHRGLHNTVEGLPENSMAAFRKAAECGFGAELDVHLMADGSLAVVHDSNLQRVCGKNLIIEEMKAADLADYPLEGTEEHIPLLADVLDVFEGRTPLIIELKVWQGNAAALTDAVMTLLQRWRGTYCIESFHPAVLLHLKKQYPAVLRGQLSQNFLKENNAAGLSRPVRFILTQLLTTAFTRPDFIAYNHQDRSCRALRVMKRLYGVHEVAWTVRSAERLKELEGENVVCIFENFVP